MTSAGKVIGMDTAASAGFQFQAAGILADEAVCDPDQHRDEHRETAFEAGKSSATVHVGPDRLLRRRPPPSVNGQWRQWWRRRWWVRNWASAVVSKAHQEPRSRRSSRALPAAKGGDRRRRCAPSRRSDGKNVPSASALPTTLIETERPGHSVKAIYLDPTGGRHTTTVTLVAGPPQ